MEDWEYHCICADGPVGDYEGEREDCPVHGRGALIDAAGEASTADGSTPLQPSEGAAWISAKTGEPYLVDDPRERQ